MKKLFLLLSVLVIILLISCQSHEHVYSEWTVEVEPTCSAMGVLTRTCDCGGVQTQPIEKTDHVYGEWKTTTEATCSEEGVKTRVCECGDTQTEPIAKTEHSFGEWETTTEPTCSKEGVKTRTCTCGEAETEAVAKLSHSYGEWKVTEEATCAKEGTQTRVCSGCGDKDTKRIATVSHNWAGGDCDEPRACTACGAEDQPVHLILGSNFNCRECGKVMTFADYSYLARDIFRGIRDKEPSAKATEARLFMYHALNGKVYALIKVNYTVNGDDIVRPFIHSFSSGTTAENGASYFYQLANLYGTNVINTPGFSTYSEYQKLATECTLRQKYMDTDPDTITISSEYLNS